MKEKNQSEEGYYGYKIVVFCKDRAQRKEFEAFLNEAMSNAPREKINFFGGMGSMETDLFVREMTEH